MEFSGKVVIVTGGGAGIGEATALAFANQGASVVVADMSQTNAESVVDKIELAGGVALPVMADVSKSNDARNIAHAAIEQYGRIDVLHNNAGIQHYGNAVTTSEEEWDHVLGVNLKSAFLCSKHCIPEMQKVGGGAIVNSASVQSFACQPNVAPYTTSKAGLLALTRSMAVDFARDNIRVNAICPGSVDTPMLRFAAEDLASDEKTAQDMIDEWGSYHPLGRVGKPEEVAELVMFLAGERSAFITGAAYLIDGGLMSTFF